MRSLIVANWKMYPRTAREARRIFSDIARNVPRGTEVVVAPPFPYLAILRAKAGIVLGAQDVFWESEGAFTGEVSPAMLKSLGARFVIVGHSERRRMLGETDDMIAKKLALAVKLRLTPILCVGEESRDADGKFFSVLKHQISAALAKVKRSDIPRVVVAYEPIWAIGAGKKPADSKDANEAALFIKKVIAEFTGARSAKSVRVLYGGSVSAKDATGFLAEREIAGLLVGRESRNPREFVKIVKCARNVS